jgi:hypothetical protein
VRWAIAVVTLGAVLAVATPLAQRGGFNNRRAAPTYAGNVRYDGRFAFVRMAYPYMGRQGAPWAHDYPTGEYNFMKIFTTITNVWGHVDESSIMTFGDPEMFKFPVIYLCEPGYWQLSEPEVKSLRDYLLKGGFMIVDDFPRQAWGQFDYEMSRVFPQLQWIQLEISHPIFHTFFEIDSFDIIPQAYNLGGRPQFWALFENNDPKGRMLVVANYQNDLSEFWEASEQGYFLVSDSNEAYKIGVNQFIYAITR